MQYFRAFARWWWLVVGAVVAGLIVGVVAGPTVDPQYTSSATVRVTDANPEANADEAYSATLLARTRVVTYAGLATSEDTAQRIVDRARLDLSPSELASKLTVTVPTSTALMSIRVSDDDPDRATRIAESTTEALIALVRRAESNGGDRQPILRAVVDESASSASAPTAAPAWRNPAIGGFGGLIVGLALAVGATRLDPRLHDDDQIAEVLDAPVLGFVPWRQAGSPADPLTSSSVLAAVRELRTAVLFRPSPDAGTATCLATTSPTSTPGLHEITVALATAIAHTGDRVLLIEADKAGTPLAQILDLDTDHRVLGSTAAGDDPTTLARSTPAGIDVVLAGDDVDSELLHSRWFASLLVEGSKRYDHVVVMAPAVLNGPEAAAIAAQCDLTLMVVEHDHTRTADLRDAVYGLNLVEAQIQGAVLLG